MSRSPHNQAARRLCGEYRYAVGYSDTLVGRFSLARGETFRYELLDENDWADPR